MTVSAVQMCMVFDMQRFVLDEGRLFAVFSIFIHTRPGAYIPI